MPAIFMRLKQLLGGLADLAAQPMTHQASFTAKQLWLGQGE